MEMHELISKTYANLQDDLSRTVFENRLLFSLTGSYKFIHNIITSTPILEAHAKKINSYLEKCNSEIVVYGAGFFGGSLPFFTNNIVAYCDSDEKKHNVVFHGYNVISPSQLKEKYKNTTVIIAIADRSAVVEITNNLLNWGFERKQIINFLDMFNDEYLYHFHQCQYFDMVSFDNTSTEEIFVDAGCLNFSNSLNFISWCNGNYKKIIAFEPNPKQYPICVENAKEIRDATVYPYGLWNKATELSFANDSSPGSAHISENANSTTKIKTVKLDDILKGEKTTFIKMDIEGAELNALKGAEQTIRKHRPKLAICVYHKPEDIWEIPAYILSLHSDYKFYLRHYYITAIETVLYAI